MAAAPGGVRVWFRLEGAASAATSVVVPSDTIVDDLRKRIKEELGDDARGVPAFKLVLSTVDGKTYDDPRALVSTLPLDQEFIVTGTLSVSCSRWLMVLAAPAAAAVYAPTGRAGRGPGKSSLSSHGSNRRRPAYRE
jgi:hypothetical protein